MKLRTQVDVDGSLLLYHLDVDLYIGLGKQMQLGFYL